LIKINVSGSQPAQPAEEKMGAFPRMIPSLTAQLSEAVPRYTSYPTAPHFHAGVNGATFRRWLDELNGDAISLYIHIPYCDRLCWFCACHTKMTRHYERWRTI
jgi:oxygen-independent coproporphyrinogen-3 oxidase